MKDQRTILLTKDDVCKLGFDIYYVQMFSGDDISKRIELLMSYLGLGTLKVTRYLKDIIDVMINEENIGITTIYKLVGDMHNVSFSEVEKDIKYFREYFWSECDEKTKNFKIFLFSKHDLYNTISNFEFLYGIKQFVLTDFKFEDFKFEEKVKELNELEKSAKILCDISNASIQVSKENKEKLALFYWILEKFSAHLGECTHNNIYCISIDVIPHNNGKEILIEQFESDSYVSNRETIKSVIDIFNSLKQYMVIENEELTKFTILDIS